MSFNYNLYYTWGCSSVGRASALQAGGQEFDSPHLHHTRNETQWSTLSAPFAEVLFLVKCTLKNIYSLELESKLKKYFPKGNFLFR